MLRNAFLTILCTLTASFCWATPLAMRYFSYDDTGETPVINVSVRVTFEQAEDEALPKAFIIEENWPEGFTVTSAQWNGEDITYQQTSTQIRWLWGYGTDHETICDGILTYAVSGIIDDTSERLSVFGKLYTYENTLVISGSHLMRPDDPSLRNITHLHYTIVPGWNLFAMPITEDAMAENAKTVRKYFSAVFTLPNDGAGSWMRAAADDLEGGMPFWVYWENNTTTMLTLTGVEAGDDDTMLLDGIYPALNHRWRLNNKNAAEDGDEVWLWGYNTWKPNEVTAVPVGQAGWIHE
jgi:hypothetical protein